MDILLWGLKNMGMPFKEVSLNNRELRRPNPTSMALIF